MARTVSITFTSEQLGWIIDLLDASPRCQENADLMSELCNELSMLEDIEMQDREHDDFRFDGGE